MTTPAGSNWRAYHHGLPWWPSRTALPARRGSTLCHFVPELALPLSAIRTKSVESKVSAVTVETGSRKLPAAFATAPVPHSVS